MALVPKKPAIIGLGEVGLCFADAMTRATRETIQLCDLNPTSAAKDLADRIGGSIHQAPGPWLADCDLVFSAVTGGVAAGVAETFGGLMQPDAIFVDITTAPPDQLANAADALSARQVRLIDVAIMGSIALTGSSTPLLMAGAPADDLSEWMTGLGFRCTVLPNSKVGEASALKLLRSLFTKGLEALTVECLLAAESRGLRERLVEQLATIDDTPISDYLDILVTSHLTHARRRLAEVEAVGHEMEKQGATPLMLEATRRRFQRTVDILDRKPLDAVVARDVSTSLAWLKDSPDRT
jgi:3-hydroxyisobutyrate dehydrogenase